MKAWKEFGKMWLVKQDVAQIAAKISTLMELISSLSHIRPPTLNWYVILAQEKACQKMLGYFQEAQNRLNSFCSKHMKDIVQLSPLQSFSMMSKGEVGK